MGISAQDIYKIVCELQQTLQGGRLQKINQPFDNALTLVIRRETSSLLHFSVHPEFFRIHLIEKKYANPPRPKAFCAFLRAHITGAVVEKICQVGGDRIVSLALRKQSGSYTLIAELIGRRSNLILLNEEGQILINALNDRSERLKRNAVYVPPLQNELQQKIAKKTDTAPPEEVLGFSRIIAQQYAEKEQESHFTSKKSQLLTEIRKKTKKLRTKEKKLTHDLEEMNKGNQHLRFGEILKQNLSTLGKGMKEIALPDYSQGGDKVTIPLDPALSPLENMERFFKTYRKAERGRGYVEEQLLLIEKEKTELLTRQKEIKEADPEQLEAAFLSEKIVQKERSKDKKGEEVSQPHKFTSFDDMTILVGKNDKQNDLLTFKIARGNDMWFHARDAHGSHVVVQMESKKEIPSETLIDAACLALHYSKEKNNEKGEVLYTQKKYVQKVKGTKAGLVTYTQDKNIFVRIDPKRMGRLMDTKR